MIIHSNRTSTSSLADFSRRRPGNSRRQQPRQPAAKHTATEPREARFSAGRHAPTPPTLSCQSARRANERIHRHGGLRRFERCFPLPKCFNQRRRHGPHTADELNESRYVYRNDRTTFVATRDLPRRRQRIFDLTMTTRHTSLNSHRVFTVL